VVDGKLILGEEDFVATIGAGGRLLMTGGTADDGSGWSNLLMLVRLPDQ
jgi:hypothetical protein